MKRISGSLGLIAGLLVLLSAGGCGGDAVFVSLHGRAVGTTYSIVVCGLPGALSKEAVQKIVEQVVAEVDSAMSLFNPDSELSRFNAHRGLEWFAVSEELARVVETARDVGRTTGGAFDVTVAPLVNLWGFGPERRPDAAPPEADIKSALAGIGPEQVEVRLNPPALKKNNPDVTLDLAGVAKGYCVDAVAERLERLGAAGFMIEVGGEVRTGGTKPDGSLWRIAVEKPMGGERSVQAVVVFTDRAMATSGDYRNYFEADGVRFSHILDPTTGRPVTHTLASVSVMDASCARADALATGLLVLGPEKGPALARKANLSAYFLEKTPEGFVGTAVGGFPETQALQ